MCVCVWGNIRRTTTQRPIKREWKCFVYIYSEVGVCGGRIFGVCVSFRWSWICFRSYHDHNNIINNFNCFMFSFAMAAVLISFRSAKFFVCLVLLFKDDNFASYFRWWQRFLHIIFFSPALFVIVVAVFVFFSLFFVFFSSSSSLPVLLCFIAVLDRISLSRNIINQFYLYKPYFQNIRSCV